jgi:7-carboxy-7-deazaguanine synthase
MFISEIYKSVQGEGLLAGTESVFIRTSGCNLRCGFCDTPFASWNPEGFHASVEQIAEQCVAFTCPHVVITGGEPMLPAGIGELTAAIAAAGHHITIETAGTVFRDVDCDLVSISPKLSNSAPPPSFGERWQLRHEMTRDKPEVINKLVAGYEYQIKFVVCSEDDINEIESWLERYPDVRRDRVLLMPEGITAEALNAKEAWIKEICQTQGFRYCPRWHILWFGNRRGT